MIVVKEYESLSAKFHFPPKNDIFYPNIVIP